MAARKAGRTSPPAGRGDASTIPNAWKSWTASSDAASTRPDPDYVFSGYVQRAAMTRKVSVALPMPVRPRLPLEPPRPVHVE
jgi:hypothetical protein